MLIEIYGISCILFLTYNKALFTKLAFDRGYSIITEYLTQTIHCISKIVCSFYAENGAYPPTQNGLIHPQLLLKWP